MFGSGNFKIFENAIGQFIPNHAPKYVITSTNNTFETMTSDVHVLRRKIKNLVLIFFF